MRRRALARVAPVWLVVLIAGVGLLSALWGETQRASDRAEALERVAEVQRADCQRSNELRAALRGILARSAVAARRAGRLSAAAEDYYRQALQDLANVDCRMRAPA